MCFSNSSVKFSKEGVNKKTNLLKALFINGQSILREYVSPTGGLPTLAMATYQILYCDSDLSKAFNFSSLQKEIFSEKTTVNHFTQLGASLESAPPRLKKTFSQISLRPVSFIPLFRLQV